MALEIIKKIKSLFKGKSSKPPAEKEQAKTAEKQPRQGRRDGFSSRRERDQKRREHSEMADSTNKVMPRRERRPKGPGPEGQKSEGTKPASRLPEHSGSSPAQQSGRPGRRPP